MRVSNEAEIKNIPLVRFLLSKTYTQSGCLWLDSESNKVAEKLTDKIILQPKASHLLTGLTTKGKV